METAQVNTGQGSSTANTFYVWEVPGKSLLVHVEFAVIDRLLIEVMRGFGAIPRRGAEVGGILLGSVEYGERTIVRVEDFEPVVSEHRRGPSYLLSEGDIGRYEDAVARHRYNPEKRIYALGCYRSHTREGMALTPEDLKQWDSYFPEASSIFLLVKPYATRVSIGGFFFREEGLGVKSDAPYLEFPFRRRELGGGPAPARVRAEHPASNVISGDRSSNAARPAAESEPEAENGGYSDYGNPDYDEDSEQDSTDRDVPGHAHASDSGLARFRRTNVWIPLSFIFLIFGTLIGVLAGTIYRPARAAGLLGDPYSMALSVSRSGDYLQVRWDRQAQPIRSAQRGTLTIIEGPYDKKVDLDVIQLQNPTVFYRHTTDAVKFRLEIFTKERVSVIETFDWHK